LLLALLSPVLRWLAGEWLGNDFYSHGVLVPVVAGFLAWRLWVRRSPTVQAAAGSWGSLTLLIGSLLVYLAALNQRAYFLAALAVIGLLAGMIGFLLGTAVLRRMAFPLLFLVFMVPLPLVEPLSVPLAQLTGECAAGAVRILGIPITVNGAQVTLPNANLVVGAQCSGLSSIVALITLAAVFLFLVDGPWWGKVLLALSVVPIAMLGNVLRVSSLFGVAQLWGADASFTYYHDYSGMVFFLSAAGLLLLFGRVLRCSEIRSDIF
jgi:exosortase